MPRSTPRGGRLVPPQADVVGMWQTMRFLMNEPAALSPGASTNGGTQMVRGYFRLWRGVQTMMIGCIPAHALYFSSYEMVKAATMRPDGHMTAWGSSMAGAAAVLSHDSIMTPLDTVKQRMQLGHYESVRSAFKTIVRKEGYTALYRSLPITLATNVPYGMIMVTTHEAAKEVLSSPDRPNWQTVLVSSSLGGLVASGLTTPCDRIKTTLQTQELIPVCFKSRTMGCPLIFKTPQDAARHIYQTEGLAGFWRGFLPRILSHTPALAISWTTYETAKQGLMNYYG
jgi:solute carrier family 25 iron transporter 28/37